MKPPRVIAAIVTLLLAAGCESTTQVELRGVELFPPLSISQAALARVDALPVTPEFFRDHWTWVGFGAADCAQACRQRLRLIDEQTQAQGLFTLVGAAGHRLLRDLGQEFSNTAVAMGTIAASIDGFYAQFDTSGLREARSFTTLYLVSPEMEVVYKIETGSTRLDLDRELNAARAANEE